MNKLNFLKPDKNNLYVYVYTGSALLFISIFDVFLSSFFNINVTSYFPGPVSLLLPLIVGLLGLHLIRIEFSGLKYLDLLNKNINTSNFNGALTLLIIFAIQLSNLSFVSVFYVFCIDAMVFQCELWT